MCGLSSCYEFYSLFREILFHLISHPLKSQHFHLKGQFDLERAEFFFELTNYITYLEGKLSEVFEIASRMINNSVRNSMLAA